MGLRQIRLFREFVNKTRLRSRAYAFRDYRYRIWKISLTNSVHVMSTKRIPLRFSHDDLSCKSAHFPIHASPHESIFFSRFTQTVPLNPALTFSTFREIGRLQSIWFRHLVTSEKTYLPDTYRNCSLAGITGRPFWIWTNQLFSVVFFPRHHSTLPGKSACRRVY